MNNQLSSVKLPTAVQHRNRFNLSFDHYTTQDFFTVKPIMVKELIPGDEVSINLQQINRTIGALNKPTFSQIKFTNRLFWIPFRCVMYDFNEFIMDTSTSIQAKPAQTPVVSNATFINQFLGSAYSEVVSLKPGEKSDFAVNTTEHRNFTNFGRRVYDLLRILGYHVNFAVPDGDTRPMSALPLLAFAKLFDDWFINPNFDFPHRETWKKNSGYALSGVDLDNIFSLVAKSYYEKDYFTSSWPRTTSPSSSDLYSAVTISDVTNDSTAAATSNFRSEVDLRTAPNASRATTPNITNASSSTTSRQPGIITQYALDKLKQLTDYVKRYQLAGSRVVDRFKAVFGIDLPEATLDRSNYLGKSECFLNIGEVMATADNENTETAVGDYAGRANAYGNGNFHFKSSEYGLLVMVSTVTPHIGYCQGRDRMVHHVYRLDFANPTFDGIGVQPIRRDEVFIDFVDANTQSRTNWNAFDVFGWTSQYAEYKNSLDVISGDLARNSTNTGLETWHTLRLFAGTTDDDSFLNITKEFTKADGGQYDRIFNYEDSDVDHFISVYHLEIHAWRNLQSMYEDYDFDGGRILDTKIGGTQLT